MAGSQSVAARGRYHLPIEITTDIVLRLPMKSLLRCKSVCKSCDGCNSIGNINLDFPFLNWAWDYTGKKYFEVVGICNGLVCISLSPLGFPLILCNPSTRQFRELPNFEWQWLDEMDDNSFVKIERVSFGFGFHSSANDYKLMRIVLYSSPIEEAIIRAHLYVMSSDTWREIDVNKVSVFFGETNNYGGFVSFVEIYGSSASAILNGVFYWLAYVRATDEQIVMSFDMGDEVFRRIGLPPDFDEECEITELKDKLALVNFLGDKLCEVWVLNEEHNSWTKQFKVGSFPGISRYEEIWNVEWGMRKKIRLPRHYRMTTVGGVKNGKLAVTVHRKVVI